ncbi:uncharacterized protein LOC111379619 [Olea europaea var. sylvestris]|uniref:uncharacterized protein LOC111379619 n=1 Tax=Olea europaea var. sylvestris TaxID=158386 RepID=UPI000C1CE69E|nr:uncharacterized protein LOC111379619 [Olea europaea var. sylvestris]
MRSTTIRGAEDATKTPYMCSPDRTRGSGGRCIWVYETVPLEVMPELTPSMEEEARGLVRDLGVPHTPNEEMASPPPLASSPPRVSSPPLASPPSRASPPLVASPPPGPSPSPLASPPSRHLSRVSPEHSDDLYARLTGFIAEEVGTLRRDLTERVNDLGRELTGRVDDLAGRVDYLTGRDTVAALRGDLAGGGPDGDGRGDYEGGGPDGRDGGGGHPDERGGGGDDGGGGPDVGDGGGGPGGREDARRD